MRKIFLGLGALLSGALLASGGGDSFPNEPFHANINDKPSLQTGAKLFVNYCAGCHSIQYQRYNRTFRDLGIDPEIGAKNLIFTGAKEVEQMHIALQPADGLKWFGQTPPDLSLTARAKGGSYIYNYLLGFYQDDSRPLGFNNSVFPGASMPNPLWKLQGIQAPTYYEEEHCSGEGANKKCEKVKAMNGFELVQKGSLSPEDYKKVAYDISNFLNYVADPSALDRQRIGPWALAFIAFLTLVFYLLKREYWRDIYNREQLRRSQES